jgi:hypothetical protein
VTDSHGVPAAEGWPRTTPEHAANARWGPLGRLPAVVALAAAVFGVVAALHYSALGLTLSHYDAKAHLVVARRILDSLTPGWEQIGAVWLPLPHLINMLPVQVDFLYRTGAFAVAISILGNAVAAMSIAWTVRALTSSMSGALLASAFYLLNPNVLYLQSTPMTEPLVFGLTTLQVALFTRWVLSGRLELPAAAGWVTVLAVLTRYEAWPITGACFLASVFAWWRRGNALTRVLKVHARLAAYPVLAVLGFVVFSKITVGQWFVSSGFFVPDETLRGQPMAVYEKVVEGIHLLGGAWLFRFAQVAVLLVGSLGLATAGRAPMLIPLTLFGAGALPVSAYLAGHPFRMRYEIPLVIACAVATGLGVGLLRRIAPLIAVAALAVVVLESRPFDPKAPMIAEAQLDRNVHAREQVTDCLRQRYRGGTIMMSMGALGHYMQELSAAGFAIRDFLHEGNGPIWDSAFTRGPAALVQFVVVEEAAEGGDAIIQRQREYPRLLEGFDRVCEGGNVALYQRKSR